jgi:hypothetical protein
MKLFKLLVIGCLIAGLPDLARADQLRAYFKWDEPLSHPVYAEPFTELVLYVDQDKADDDSFPVHGDMAYRAGKYRYPVDISGSCHVSGKAFMCTLKTDVYGIRFRYGSLYSTLQVNSPNEQTRIATHVETVLVQNAERL